VKSEIANQGGLVDLVSWIKIIRVNYKHFIIVLFRCGTVN
jgi:hypothetical protein